MGLHEMGLISERIWNDGETAKVIGIIYFGKQEGMWYKMLLRSEARTNQGPYRCAKHFQFYSKWNEKPMKGFQKSNLHNYTSVFVYI